MRADDHDRTARVHRVRARLPAAKEKLRPIFRPRYREETISTPATPIIAYDPALYWNLPKTFRHRPEAIKPLEGEEKKAGNEAIAFRNYPMRSSHLMIAAHALDLDNGPVSGFDNAKADAAFCPDGRRKSGSLRDLGTGDSAEFFPHSPRPLLERASHVECTCPSRSASALRGIQGLDMLGFSDHFRSALAVDHPRPGCGSSYRMLKCISSTSRSKLDEAVSPPAHDRTTQAHGFRQRATGFARKHDARATVPQESIPNPPSTAAACARAALVQPSGVPLPSWHLRFG